MTDFSKQLFKYHEMQGRVQSAIGGVTNISQAKMGQIDFQQHGAFDYMPGEGDGQEYLEKARNDNNLKNQIQVLNQAASLNYKAKANYTLKVQLS